MGRRVLRFRAYSLFGIIRNCFWLIIGTHIDTISQSLSILSFLHLGTLRNRYFRSKLESVSWQHQLSLKLVDFIQIKWLILGLLQLFDSICIFESIESIFWATTIRRNIPYHDSPAIACERIFEDHRKFAASKRGVVLILVKSTNALLQSQQTLVDLCSVNPGLFLALIGMVSSPLTPSQINEWNLTMKFVLPFQTNLQDSVGSRRIIIGSVLAGHPCRSPKWNIFHQITAVCYLALRQPNNVYVVFMVLPR